VDTSESKAQGFAVATPHRYATEKAVEVLKKGGSAADAAIAAAAILCVIYPQDCALGGDLVALLHRKDGSFTSLLSIGSASMNADVEVVRSEHALMPQTGPLTVTVPGLVAGLGELHNKAGRLPWAELLAPAAKTAASGVPISEVTARFLAEGWAQFSQDEGMRSVFGDDKGAPLKTGDLLVQRELGNTLIKLAELGSKEFYAGSVAVNLVAGMTRIGIQIDEKDLISHEAEWKNALSVGFAGKQVYTSPPATQGFIFLGILKALERSDLDIESRIKLQGSLVNLSASAAGFQDEFWGEWEGSQTQDIDEAWIDGFSAKLSTAMAGAEQQVAHKWRGDTVAIVIRDSEGDAVTLIQSLSMPFGAGLLDPKTGIIFHNRGAAFTLQPNKINTLGPGRRPPHTLMPVMVAEAGSLRGLLGTMGGKSQPQILLQVLLRLLAQGSAENAVTAPRWVFGGRVPTPDVFTLTVEPGLEELSRQMSEEGWSVDKLSALSDNVGHVQVIWLGEKTWEAASDPRSDGSAMAW
jgi:gamma-glutamyltranspeptidase